MYTGASGAEHWRRRASVGLGTLLAAAWPAAAQDIRVEAENCCTPVSAWQTNRLAADRWNLWSTDVDAQAKWSGGVVLQSPVVKADRGTPEEGAPPLRVQLSGLTNGAYDVTLRVGRTLAVSLDGQTWRPYRGELLLDQAAVTNGTLAFWVDDRYATTGNIGSAYFDYVTLSRTPPPVPKPRVAGSARTRVAERLDRGLVAVPDGSGAVYVGWRLLAGDPADVGFHVYRQAGAAAPERLTRTPIRQTTDFVDREPPPERELTYTVRAVTAAGEGAPEGAATARPGPDARAWLGFALDGGARFQRCGVADLDGDGRYDYVLKQPHGSIDPYKTYWKASADTYKLEAYRHDGKLLWRHDLGWSIEAGIWYSPYLVYDFDGDGRAEVAAKTGAGDPRGPDGRVSNGPEWVTVWDGATGRERARAPWPGRAEFGDDERGYNYASRNQLAVAYLDGKTPFLIVLRGTYTIMRADAYELTGDTLRAAWSFRSEEGGRRYRGQGCHFTHAADVDGDGRDEVILGSSVIDDNGAPLWSTGLGHPDAAYVGDIDPRRPGLEIYFNIEPPLPRNAMCLVDAATGARLWGYDGPTRHVHSFGLCADIDAAHAGAECYGADSANHKPTGDRWLWAADGTLLSRAVDFGFGRRCAYWDADLQRELVVGDRLVDFGGTPHAARVRGEVVLVADIAGDWREELIVSEGGELRIHTTTLPATDRRVTLMQDPIYRADVAMSTMGYWLVPMTSYALDATAPNLNLTVAAERPGTVRLAVSAPLGAPLRGTVRLRVAGGACRPAEFDIALAPGERIVREATVAAGDGAGAADLAVEAELRHTGGTLAARALLPER